MLTTFLLSLTLTAAPQGGRGGAQEPSRPQAGPTRDPATEKKGTASIKGKITSSDGGRPLRRAQITLTAPELTERRSTSTNPQGAYEFAELPAGRYTISVSRNGHFTLQYRSAPPWRAAKTAPDRRRAGAREARFCPSPRRCHQRPALGRNRRCVRRRRRLCHADAVLSGTPEAGAGQLGGFP